MDSIVAFFLIIAGIVGAIILLFIAGYSVAFMIEGGGCMLLIGLALVILGVYLVIEFGGFPGGLGILLALFGCGFVAMSIDEIKEFFR